MATNIQEASATPPPDITQNGLPTGPPQVADQAASLPPEKPLAQIPKPGVNELPPEQPLSSLNGVYDQVKHLDSTQAAPVVSISQRTGQDPNFIAANLPAVQAELNKPNFEQVEADAPDTTDFLRNPANMALYKNKVAALVAQEQLVSQFKGISDYAHSFMYGINQIEAGAAALPGTVASMLMAPGNALAKEVTGQPGVTVPNSWVNNPLTQYFENLASQEEPPAQEQPITSNLLKGNFKPLLTNLAAGLPQLGLLALGPEMAAPAMAALQGSDVEAKNLKAGVNPVSSAEDAALQALVNYGSLKLGTLPVLQKWMETFGHTAGPMVQKQLAVAIGKTIGGAVGTGVLQGSGMSLANDASDYLTGTNPHAMDGSLGRAMDNALMMSGQNLLLGGYAAIHGSVARAVTGAKLAHAQKIAENTSDFVQKLDDLTAQTKDANAPEIHQKFVDKIAPDTHLYVPPEALEKYFQSKKEDPANAIEQLGLTPAVAEAKESGLPVQIPLSTWTDKFAGTDLANAMKPYLKAHPEDMSIDEINSAQGDLQKTSQEAQETYAQGAQPQDENQETDYKASEKAIYKEMAEKMGVGGAKRSTAGLVSRFFGQLGRRTGIDPQQLFNRWGYAIFGKNNAFQGMIARAKPAADVLSEAWKQLSPEQKLDHWGIDPVTYTQNQRAFEAQTFNPDKPMVAHISVSGVKHLNDFGGHQAGDDLYQHVGQALAKVDPTIAKVGGDFATHVKDQAELNELLKKAQALLPEKIKVGAKTVDTKAYKLTGVAAEGIQDAAAAHKLLKDEMRSRGELSPREGTPLGFQEFPNEKGVEPTRHTSPLTEEQKAVFNALGPQEAFDKTHFDSRTKYGNGPGMLNYEAYRLLPKKAYQVSIDIDGINAINETFGHKEGGDEVIKEFSNSAQKMEQEMREEFNLTHKSGDEFLAQHDDRKKLKDFLLEVSKRVAQNEFKWTAIKSNKDLGVESGHHYEISGLGFSAGGGVDNDNAERSLKELKNWKKYRSTSNQNEVPGISPENKIGGDRRLDFESGRRDEEWSRGVNFPDDTNGVLSSGSESGRGWTSPRAQSRLEQQLYDKTPQGWFKKNKYKVLVPPPKDESTSAIDRWKKRVAEMRRSGMPVATKSEPGAYSPSDLAEKIYDSYSRDPEASFFHDHPFLKNLADEAVTDGGAPRPDAELDDLQDWFNHFSSKDKQDFLRSDVGQKLLDQANGEEEYSQAGDRGHMTINPKTNPVFQIFLNPNADFSTIVHELGHSFLKVMQDLAEEPGASKDIVDDYKTVRKWLGAEEGKEFTRDQHEQFARGFEAYIRDGKVPATGSKRMFERFRDWMVNIYKSVTELNVDLSPEIRGVFDRMLASHEEIEEAQHQVGYKDVAIPGLTPEQQAHLQQLRDEARQQAEDELLKPQMEELTQKHKEFLASEEKRFRTEAEKAVDESPQGKGSLDLAGRTGQDPKEVAQRILDGTASPEDEGHMETSAELADLGPSKAAAQRLMDFNREAQVNQRVQAQMDQYKDMRLTPAIRAEALKAIHNVRMTELLALEHQYLAEATGPHTAFRQETIQIKRKQAIIAGALAKQQASEILSRKYIREATNPRPYFTGEKNAAVNGEKARLAGDREKSAKFKQQQLLNHALASAALRNQKEMERMTKVLTPYAKRRGDMKDMPYAYIRQISKLLDNYNVGPTWHEDSETLQKMAMEMKAKGSSSSDIVDATGFIFDLGRWRQETLAQFMDRVNEDSYNSADFPPQLLSEAKKIKGEVTMEEMRDLKNAVKYIATIGKFHDRFFDETLKLGIQDAANMARLRAEKAVGAPLEDQGRPGDQFKSKLPEKIHRLLQLPKDAVLNSLNTLTLCEYLDGGHDGPWHDFLYRPFEKGQNKKIQMQHQASQEVNELMEKYYTPAEVQALKKDKINFDFLNGTKEEPLEPRWFSKWDLITLAQNLGNQQNLDRVRDGFGVNDDKVSKMVSSLTPRDWDFVQARWDYLEKRWPQIKAQEMKLRGVEPEKVAPIPYVHQYGMVQGGYWPIDYDPEKTTQAYLNAEQKNALFKRFSATAAHTETGFTKSRVKYVARALKLSDGVFLDHENNVMHDLAYRQAVIDVSRFLKQQDTRTAIQNTLGVRGYSYIGNWLKDIASDQRDTTNIGDSVARWFRYSSTFSRLAFRPVMAPILAGSNTVNAWWANTHDSDPLSGAIRTAKTFSDFYMHPKDNADFIQKSSVFMKNRYMFTDKNLNEMMNRFGGNHQALKAFSFASELLGDYATSYPIWLDTYKRNVNDAGHEKAVSMADEQVTRTMGSGSPIDTVGIQRGSELQKTVFASWYSWASMMFNRAWLDGKIAGLHYDRGNVGKAVGVLAGTLIFGWGLQTANESLWREMFRNSPPNENKKDKDKRVAERVLDQPFSYFWLTRDLADYGIQKALGDPQADLQLGPMADSAKSVIDPLVELDHNILGPRRDHKFTEKEAKDMASAASLVMGYPNQFNNWTFNFLDYLRHGHGTWKDIVGGPRTKR